jgi:hypothetical protein
VKGQLPTSLQPAKHLKTPEAAEKKDAIEISEQQLAAEKFERMNVDEDSLSED